MPDIFDSAKKKNANLVKTPQLSDKGLEKSTSGKSAKRENFAESQDRHNLPNHTHNPLSAYSYLPDRVSFINEDPEEKVVLLLRRHPVTNLGWITTSFLMIIAPAFITVLTPLELLPLGFQFILTLVWYLITSAFILEEFLSWFFHVNIVTDERIIEVDFVNLVYREITDANIDQIQDVTVEVGGALRTLLHYGDVIIQTAAQVPKIEFEAVPNPDAVARVLRELRIEEEREKLEGRVR
jgi:hypothetical protein